MTDNEIIELAEKCGMYVYPHKVYGNKISSTPGAFRKFVTKLREQDAATIAQKDTEIERLKEQLRTAYPLSDTLHNAQEQIKMLREAGQAIVDRWDTPNWKIVEATATYINALRYVLETTKPNE